MNTIIKTQYFYILFILSTLVSCSKDNETFEENYLTLYFNNTFKNTSIILGDATSSLATVNTSVDNQVHHFSELKYVISNIRLIKNDGTEVPYHVNDLDNGATVIDQAKLQTCNYILSNIPKGEYKQIKFGLGIKPELNSLDQIKFPLFYSAAGANDTKMMWEWGTGYRFTKIEGFYDVDNKTLSVHTGSTVEGTNGQSDTYTQGVDAYREIVLTFPSLAIVGQSVPKVTIKADFDKLLSGKINTIELGTANATPSTHTAVNMVKFVDNLGGNGTNDLQGMFSVTTIVN